MRTLRHTMNRRGFFTSLCKLGVVTALGPGIVKAAIKLVPVVTPKLTIAQIVAISYPLVPRETLSLHNTWAETAMLRELERGGAISRTSKQSFEIPIKFVRNYE